MGSPEHHVGGTGFFFQRFILMCFGVDGITQVSSLHKLRYMENTVHRGVKLTFGLWSQHGDFFFFKNFRCVSF